MLFLEKISSQMPLIIYGIREYIIACSKSKFTDEADYQNLKRIINKAFSNPMLIDLASSMAPKLIIRYFLSHIIKILNQPKRFKDLTEQESELDASSFLMS